MSNEETLIDKLSQLGDLLKEAANLMHTINNLGVNHKNREISNIHNKILEIHKSTDDKKNNSELENMIRACEKLSI